MSGKVVAVGLAAIAACAVGSYFLLTQSEQVILDSDIAAVPDAVPDEGNFIGNVLSDSMVSIGLKEPLGIRNNNPLNLRWYSTINWQGQVGQNRGFAVFDKPENGIRAATRTLDTYSKRGINTVEKIVATWAPAVENNVEAYISSVCKNSGLNRTQVISKSRGDYLALLKAMIKHENGKQPYLDSTILAGIQAA